MPKIRLDDHNQYLAAKKRTSAIGNCVLISITMWALRRTEPFTFEPWFALAIAGLSLKRGVLPMPKTLNLGLASQRRWYFVYATLTLLTALTWGLLAAFQISIKGANHDATIFMMIINAGIAAAGSNSLTPNRRLAGIFALLVLVPMGLALANQSFTAYAPIIGLLISYQFFLILQVGENSKVINQLREREEQYGTLVNASHEGILIHEGGRVVEINPGFTRMLGYSAAELIGTSVLRLIHPEDRALNAEEMEQGSEVPRVTRAIHGDGSTHVVEVRARNMTYRGRAARVLCVQDLTSHAEAEEARRASEAEARSLVLERERAAVEALRVRSDFLANMSHEIRTPLNAIIGLTDLLAETGEGEARARYVRTLKQSGEGLLALVNDILDFSKIDAGRLEFELGTINLTALIEDQCDLLAGRALAKGLTLSTFVDPRMPAHVRGDAGRISQVLLNLVSNAIKFTERGEIHVLCRADSGPNEIWRVVISVRDTGIGIPDKLQGRLFSPFSQGDSSMSRKFGGTGLGLSICKRLVDAMDGNLGVTSVEGTGTTFTVEIPLAAVTTEAPRAMPPSINTHLAVVSDEFPAAWVVRDYALAWSIPLRMMTLAELQRDGITANEILVAAVGAVPPVTLRTTDFVGEILIDPSIRHRVSTAVSNPRVRTLPSPIRQNELIEALTELTRPVADSASAARPTTGPTTVETFLPARVLVVEDNSTNQMLILAVLARLGLSTQAVVNGVEAVSANEMSEFDLILMDCQMPEMDGYEATRRIRAREVGRARRIPIVALTANVTAEDRERCLDSGMDGFVPKPVRREKLVAELGRFLKMKGDRGEKAG